MPNYVFECPKCEKCFEEICSFADFDAGFPEVSCPDCKSTELKKNIMTGEAPGAVFADPKESSKWDNWHYRQGFTAEKAKKERAAAEKAAGYKPAYRNIDDIGSGRRMNYTD